ncbi:MAG: TSUP family transporter [Acetivibrionales bacterium]
MLDANTVILFVIGLAAGVAGGMGMGGGAVLIPALVLVANPEQHTAQSVNLLFFIPTAVIALVIHIKNRQIDWKMAVPIIISGLAGAFAGSRIAAGLAAGTLKKCFGFFLIALSVCEMFRKGKEKDKGKDKDKGKGEGKRGEEKGEGEGEGAREQEQE